MEKDFCRCTVDTPFPIPVYCLLLNMKAPPRITRHSEASDRSNRNLPKQKRNLGDNAEGQGKVQNGLNRYPQKAKKSFVSTGQETDATKNGLIRKEEVALGNKIYDPPQIKKKRTEKLKGKVKAIAQKVGQKDKDMETKRENITFEINPTKRNCTEGD